MEEDVGTSAYLPLPLPSSPSLCISPFFHSSPLRCFAFCTHLFSRMLWCGGVWCDVVWCVAFDYVSVIPWRGAKAAALFYMEDSNNQKIVKLSDVHDYTHHCTPRGKEKSRRRSNTYGRIWKWSEKRKVEKGERRKERRGERKLIVLLQLVEYWQTKWAWERLWKVCASLSFPSLPFSFPTATSSHTTDKHGRFCGALCVGCCGVVVLWCVVLSLILANPPEPDAAEDMQKYLNKGKGKKGKQRREKRSREERSREEETKGKRVRERKKSVDVGVQRLKWIIPLLASKLAQHSVPLLPSFLLSSSPPPLFLPPSSPPSFSLPLPCSRHTVSPCTTMVR